MEPVSLVKTKDLTKIYNGTVKALERINLEVFAGERVAVQGPSGSGKSTLLNLLGALDRPTSGEVWFAGTKLSDVRDLDRFRSYMVGFVFQMYNLIPTLTALENVEVPIRWSLRSQKERRERSLQLLELVGLADRAGFLPAQLSGGQRQRVAIARALANNPRMILADEPTGNLDTASGVEIMAVLQRINQELGTTVLIVTHNPAVVRCMQRVITLSDGHIVCDERIENLYVKDLLDFRASALGQKLLVGQIPEGAQGLGLEAFLSGLQSVLDRI